MTAFVDYVFRRAAAVASPGGARARLTILFYHRVLPAFDPLLPDECTANVFDAQMTAFASAFTILSMDDAIERWRTGTLPERAACITFDDGYRNNFEVAVPVLRRHGATGTFFVASDFLDGGLMFNDCVRETVRRLPNGLLDLSWVGLPAHTVDDDRSRIALIDAFIAAVKYLPPEERADVCGRLAGGASPRLPSDLMMTSEQVRSMQHQGMTIGGHTLTHPILNRIPDDECIRQIAGNRERLASLLDDPPRHFAYPNGRPGVDYAARHVEMVKAAGYSSAVSTARGAIDADSDPFQLPRFSPWHKGAHRFRISLLRNLARRPHPAREFIGAEAAE